MSALSDRIGRANHQGWNSRKIESEAQERGHTLSNATAWKILKGTHGTVTDETLQALADLFDIPFDELRGLIGLPAESEPWEPPVVSSRLTMIQRELLEQLIHQLVRPQEKVGTQDAATPAKKGPARGRGAPDPLESAVTGEIRGPNRPVRPKPAKESENPPKRRKRRIG